MPLRRLLPALFCLGLIGCAGTPALDSPQARYLPPFLPSLYFEMPLADFQQLRPDAVLVEEDAFKRVYRETDLDDPAATAITYAFATAGTRPLYEVRIEYETLSARNVAAEALLGAPNHDGNAWRFGPPSDFLVRAWTYATTLVIVGNVPGTEWYEPE